MIGLILFFYSSINCQTPQDSFPVEFSKAKAYYALSDSFSRIDFDSCRVYVEKAENIYRSINAYSEQVKCLNSLATLAYYQNDFSTFSSLQDEVAALAKEKLDSRDDVYSMVYNNLCVLSRQRGRYNDAIDYGLNVVNNTSLSDKLLKATTCEQLSYVYSIIGFHDESLRFSKLGLKLKLDTLNESKFGIGEAYYANALANHRAGNLILAKSFYLKTEPYFYKYKKHPAVKDELIKVWLQLIEINLELENGNDNTFLQTRIDSLMPIDKDGVLKADYLSLLARQKFQKGDRDSVFVNMLEKANSIYAKEFISTKSDFSIARNVSLIADYYSDKGNLVDSEKYYLEALSAIGATSEKLDLKSIPNKMVSLSIVEKLASIAVQKNDHDKARQYFKFIYDLSKQFVLENNPENYKLYWAEQQQNIFEKAIDYYVVQGDFEEAFKFSEACKSNLLINQIDLNRTKGFSSIPQDVLEKEQKLRSDISYLEEQMYYLSKSIDDEDEFAKLNLVKLESEISLKKQVASYEKKYPEFYNLKYDLDNSYINDLRSNMSSDQALLEFFVSDNNTFLFVITSDEIECTQIEKFSQKSKLIDQFYNALRNRSESLTDISIDLYNYLLKDVINQLNEDISDLIIVPDASLVNIPFELLKDENDEWLGFKYNIQYQYSAKLWNILKQRTVSDFDHEITSFAYNNQSERYFAERSCNDMQDSNLKCGQKEVDIINEILDDKSNLIVENNIEALFEKASRSKVFHLATHACVDRENSNFSKIYFNNGHITNVDLQSKKINSDLVVVSACESGYGEIVKGEGSMSISKGFFHAGCKSTVVSLWPIDDCTTLEVMQYFYTYLKAGQRKDIALSNAKKSYTQNAHPLRTHPYYWAGFVVIGDVTPIWNNELSYLKWLAGAFLMFLLFYIFILRSKR